MPHSPEPDHSLRSVLALSAPIGLAFIPLGMALEFLMVHLAATAAPLATVALTTFVVNSRHAFYALSFPLHRVRGVLAKSYSTYTLSDEAYAVGCQY